MDNKIRALVIDGSYTNRILFKAILEIFDFEVTEVCNAVKALQLMKKVQPHIILLDMSIPLEHGYAFLDSIATSHKDIPVIVVSVYDDQEIIREAYRRGASDYLVKPIDAQQLAAKLSQYIECEI